MSCCHNLCNTSNYIKKYNIIYVSCLENIELTLQSKIKIKSSEIVRQKQDNERMKCLGKINVSKFFKFTL